MAAAFAICISLLASLSAVAGQKPGIAIIIDDLGYQLSIGRRVTGLPGPISCAVLPATPRGEMLAEEANAAGKDVLLHLPLEAIHEDAGTEPGGITMDMGRREFAQVFEADMKTVPHAIGVNNHRGSLLTRHPGHMSWLMEELNERGSLIFVDSYTTRDSIALQLAHESGVPAVRRDVFLDPDEEPGTIAREFDRLKKIARMNGLAVGIGHPHPATIDFLERELPGLASEGIELISISELVRRDARHTGVEAVGRNEQERSDGILR